jgi:hypothetical protein
MHDFGGEPDGKRPLGRPRHRMENNIIILSYWQSLE